MKLNEPILLALRRAAIPESLIQFVQTFTGIGKAINNSSNPVRALETIMSREKNQVHFAKFRVGKSNPTPFLDALRAECEAEDAKLKVTEENVIESEIDTAANECIAETLAYRKISKREFVVSDI